MIKKRFTFSFIVFVLIFFSASFMAGKMLGEIRKDEIETNEAILKELQEINKAIKNER